MSATRLRSTSILVILAVVSITACVSVQGLWRGGEGDGWKRTIRSDALGYYGYLQAIFIRKDLGNEEFVREYVNITPNGTLNKYFAGTSVLMAPWFGIGHALAMQDGSVPQDGTSAYEQKAISAGAWVYLLLGLLAMRALFLGIGVRDGVVAWTMAGLALGTPLLQYAAMQPGWSHIYSFSAIAAFLLAIHRLAIGGSFRWAFAAALLLGLIVLIRPVNAMVVLAIPIVAGPNTKALLQRMFGHRKQLLIAVVLTSVVVAIQPMLWFAQTGKLIEWGYANEGFYWTRPELFKVLFGFRRGLFLYTPLMLLAALGAVLLWRKDRQRASWTMAYWAVSSYIISCWWIWYYGGGFGSRVYIDHYPVLTIAMVLMLHQWTAKRWLAARLFIVLCIGLNLAQLWQYHNGLIHHECMDRQRYFYTFLRFDDTHKNKLGGNYQEAPYHPNGMDVILTESCDLDNPCHYWSGEWIDHDLAFSNRKVCSFSSTANYGIEFQAGTEVLPTDRWLFLEVGLQRYDGEPEGSMPILGVTEVRTAKDSISFYQPFPMNPVPGTPYQWEQLEYRIPVPPLAEGDRLYFYLWNQDYAGGCLIDDVFMRVSAVRPY
ncbi:MAG: hypothetical protein R2818_02725 [Flavobacteriales bacterium]